MKNGIKVVIDCDFDSYQTDKEQTSLKQQIMFSYSENKRSEQPLNLSLCGVSSNLMAGLEKLNCSNWDFEISTKPYVELFDLSKLVYLTADSDTVLDSFDADSVYVIGGIVDHNRHKGLSYQKANQDNIKTAKLPLAKYVQLQRSAVLTVNHMISLILKFAESQDWVLAISQALPQRKIAKVN